MNFSKYIFAFSFFLSFYHLALAQLPLNPFAPASSWPESHGTYCQQNSMVNAITELDSIVVDTITFPQSQFGFIPQGTIVSEFYDSSNVYCFWGCNGNAVYKAACTEDSTVLISKRLSDLGGGNSTSFCALMDKNNYFYVLSDFKLLILRDSIVGDPYSAVVTDTILDLSSYQNGDELRGIKMLYSGELVVTSTSGKIIIIDRINKNVLYDTNLNEAIINNMAVDEENNLYINTDTSLSKFYWDGDSLNLVWSIIIGRSGSTPTLIGNSTLPASQQLVAVTDMSHPNNLVLVWRDTIPAGWSAIPGWPIRVAAVQPITFNTAFPTVDVAPGQNSLMVENNSILLARWTGLFPLSSVFNPGLEKWTWNPSSKLLTQDWVNTTTFFPNAMQCLSTSNGYFYSIGEKFIGLSKYWTFEAIEWLTGTVKIQRVLGPHYYDGLNVKGSGVQIGPYGEIITMSNKMIFRFRKANAMFIKNVEAESENNFTVFPNPASVEINISVPTANSFTISIFNEFGDIVKSDKNKSVMNISLLNAGVYYMKMEGITNQNKKISGYKKIVLIK
ncbi:MAG: T9SS type A sorting domain-containing protein [Bacteroidota bacterium]